MERNNNTNGKGKTMKTKAKQAEYAVKAVKTFMGHDGDPSGSMECTLYKDGKKIGMVVDDSWGGGLQFHLEGNEENLLCDFCKTLPKWTSEFDKEKIEYDMSADVYINSLVSKFLENKEFRRKCKSKTLFILSGQAKGEFWEVKLAYNPKTKAYLEDKYGDELVEIINERFV